MEPVQGNSEQGVALLFWKERTGSAELLFGDSPAPEVQHAEAVLDAVLPELTFTARAIPDARVVLVATLPALTFAADANYASRTVRPEVGKVAQAQQVAIPTESGASDKFRVATSELAEQRSEWQVAARLSSGARTRAETTAREHAARRSSFTGADRVTAMQRRAQHQDGIRTRQSRMARYENAVGHVGIARRTSHQDAIRIKQGRASRYQSAVTMGGGYFDYFGTAHPQDFWFSSREQDAQRPPAGRYIKPVIPTPPEHAWTADLLFTKQWDGSSDIVFGWTSNTGTVIVPVRSVYMVTNEISLRRVSNNLFLPPLSFSLKVERGSWTWGFSATFPLSVEADLQRGAAGQPVELEAMINGHAYRVLVESHKRDRAFGTGTFTVSGRGKSALLDAPYAPVASFTNSESRTAQQLMHDALTINGVSLGWDIDWQLTDWLVPAGAWAHQGSYISAIKTIAEAAGGYLLPHPTLDKLYVNPTYPTAPWEWGTVTPDFELPAALTTTEAIEWLERPDYNGIYLQGSILAHVKRTGTAGDALAQMVVDPLITHADAARQRGISLLGDTGNIANITLRVPVLEETGVIEPGKFINYVDEGVQRIGLVRSTDISVGYPEVFQTLGVETHV